MPFKDKRGRSTHGKQHLECSDSFYRPARSFGPTGRDGGRMGDETRGGRLSNQIRNGLARCCAPPWCAHEYDDGAAPFTCREERCRNMEEGAGELDRDREEEGRRRAFFASPRPPLRPPPGPPPEPSPPARLSLRELSSSFASVPTSPLISPSTVLMLVAKSSESVVVMAGSLYEFREGRSRGVRRRRVAEERVLTWLETDRRG